MSGIHSFAVALSIALTPPILLATGRTNPVAIEFPSCKLHLSLPPDVKLNPWRQPPDPIFYTSDPTFNKNGEADLVSAYVDFDGPFWVGTRGSLSVGVFVQRRDGTYNGSISTLDDLDRYIRWWSKTHPEFQFDWINLNGSIWVRRWYDTFGRGLKPDQMRNEIYSIPLDNEEFLEISIQINEWIPGTTDKWKAKADLFRKAITESILLEKKPNQRPDPTPASVTPAAVQPTRQP
jgi:hypothetical protein